jgi:hypothetical protein
MITRHDGDGAGVGGTSLEEAHMPARADFVSATAWAAAWRKAQQEAARKAKRKEYMQQFDRR